MPRPLHPEDASPASPTEPRPAPELHVVTSGEATHYLFELPLHPDDLVTAGPLMQREMAYTFVDGGQFEIFLEPAVLPVEGPGCDEAIIVRMPWTNPDLPGAAEDVEVKRTLFSRVDDLRHDRTPEVRVVVQLDPNVEVAMHDPKQVSLTRCEIFFRHAPETYAYVDHLNP